MSEKCHYTCKTCSGPDFDHCLTCEDNNNREKIGSVCKCKVNYFEYGYKKCTCNILNDYNFVVKFCRATN